MSAATEQALHEALVAHLRDTQEEGVEPAMEADDLLFAWVVAFAAEPASQAGQCRYGHASPQHQHYHVSHGLAAGLKAAFDNGIGSVQMIPGGNPEEGY